MPRAKDPTLRKCSRCRRWKRAEGPAPEFYRPDHMRCATCHRLDYTRRYQDDPEFREREKARVRAYRAAHPDRVRATRRAGQERARERVRAIRATPLGKLRHNRNQARCELARARTPEQADRIRARLAAYVQEIARIEAARIETDGTNESPRATAPGGFRTA